MPCTSLRSGPLTVVDGARDFSAPMFSDCHLDPQRRKATSLGQHLINKARIAGRTNSVRSSTWS